MIGAVTSSAPDLLVLHGVRVLGAPPPADVVPNELLALNPTPAALGRATALGATEVETVAAGALGLRVERLRLPAGLSVQNALAPLVTTDPGVFERHHRYTLQQT